MREPPTPTGRQRGPLPRPVASIVGILWIDLGGVVLRDPRPIAVRALRQVARRNRRGLAREYYRLSRRIDTGSMGLRSMFDRLQRSFCLTIGYREFRTLVCERSLFAYPEVLRALRRLRRARSVRIVFTSNVSREVWQGARRQFSLSRYADAATLSYRVRSLKPSAKFFRDAMRRSRGDRRSIVFLDDSHVNIAAARRMGVRSCRVPSPAWTVHFLGGLLTASSRNPALPR